MEQPVYFSSTLYASKRNTYNGETIRVDGGDLGQKIEDKCNDLHSKGYNVISILPLIKGGLYSDTMRNGYGASGGGWSVTDGVIITAKLRSVEQ